MEIFTLIKNNTYQDSMKLMQLQASLQKVPGVILAGVAMASPENKAQFRGPGLLTPEMEQASPNDLCIVLQAETKEAVAAVEIEIEKYFSARAVSTGYAGQRQVLPKSISTAVKRLPGANVAVISVPGAYAGLEAAKALQSGLHVFLFSDNVPVEEEVELKTMAVEKGLLVMGPDCGTAIIAGIPLGFSNRVRKGRIGIVGASGTGMQEVCSLIHRMGEGISQAIGTGGRDLTAEVGGKTFSLAFRALLADPETEVIILMSKHCDQRTASQLLEQSRESEKPLVIYFPGADSLPARSGCFEALNLEHIASLAVNAALGKAPARPIDRETVFKEMRGIIEQEKKKFSPRQKYLRAFFTGGTFADQANEILPTFFNRVYAYPGYGKQQPLDDPMKSKEHCIVDLGDDFFTRGKVHPMIDPTPRVERIEREIEDPAIRVVLLDVVLGYGCHPDPGGSLAEVIGEAGKSCGRNGGHVSFVISLCGTDEDPQNYREQKEKLEKAGAIVTDSSTRAAFLAGWIGS
jgi:succinyl-CoA synthetase alpha subunit